MKIPKKYQFEHVSCLPNSLENKIMKKVKSVVTKTLLNKEEKQEAIENANCSKVCDLEDTIQIMYV